MLKRPIVLLLLAFLAASQTVQAAGYNCLKLENLPDSAVLFNWQTGTMRKLSLPYSEDWYGQHAMITFSPDGRYAAYLRMDDSNPNAVPSGGSLMVAPANAFGELGQETTVHSGLVVPILSIDGWDTSQIEFRWSSDSRWLIYRWEDQPSPTDPPLQYVALATPDGKTLRVITLPTVDYVSLGWGAVHTDGPDALYIPYVALILTKASQDNSSPSETQFAFLKIPEMTIRYPFSSDENVASIFCLSTDNYGPCPAWSPDKRRLAIGRLDRDGKADMVILDPSQPTPIATFSIPDNGAAIWSPDGQAIAVFSAVNPGDSSGTPIPDLSRARISVFGVKNGSHAVVTENAFIWRGGDAVQPNPAPPMQWCDSRHLEYLARVMPDNDLIIQTGLFSLPLGYATSFSAPVIVTNGISTDYDLTQQMITLDCKTIYDIQHFTDISGDHVAILNDSTHKQVQWLDHVITGTKWIGTIALTWWHGGLAWMDADSSNRHEIDLDADITPQDVSADGQWLLFTGAQSPPADLYIANLKTGAYRLLLTNATKWHYSPHDRYVLATDGKPSGSYLIALPDGQPQLIDLGTAATGEGVYRLEWSPDGMVFAVFASDTSTSTLDVFRFDGAPIRHFDNVPAFNSVSWPSACEK